MTPFVKKCMELNGWFFPVDDHTNNLRVKVRNIKIGKPSFRLFVMFGRTMFYPVNRAAFFHVVLMERKSMAKAINAKENLTVFI